MHGSSIFDEGVEIDNDTQKAYHNIHNLRSQEIVILKNIIAISLT